MSCPRCQSTRTYQFEASSKARTAPGPLPLVCRDCGCISVGGAPMDLPEAMERQAVTLAEAAAVAGKETTEQLANDPNPKVEEYYERLYKAAYLDGFLRALLFFRHNAKEGRLIRLRELWRGARVDIPRGSSDIVVSIDGDRYTEFEQLLFLSVVPEAADAKSSSNKQAPVHQGNS